MSYKDGAAGEVTPNGQLRCDVRPCTFLRRFRTVAEEVMAMLMTKETRIDQPVGISPTRRIALVVGALFIAGDISGVLSFAVTSGLFKDPGYLTRIAAHPNRVVIGALCVMAMGSFLAAIPMLMHPIFRSYSQALSMGYVIVRGALETMAYVAQAATWLLLLALSRDYVKLGSRDTSQFGTLGRLLVKAQASVAPNLTSLVFAVSAVIFSYLFYQSRLIPRWLSIWGLVGAPLYFAAGLLGLFDVSVGFLMAPLALQEVVLAVRLITHGFDAGS